MPRHVELTGRRVNRLLVLGRSDRKGPDYWWRCQCDCGNTVELRTYSLTAKRAQKSCGCIRLIQPNSRKHGLSKSPEHQAWSGAKSRCYDTADKGFVNYGGRGIVMCDRWREDFRAFYADMGPRPAKGFSLERRDNNGHYAPENCYWAPRIVQANNKRRVKIMNINGESLTMSQASRKFGIRYTTLRARILRQGMDPARAVAEPLQQ